MLSELIPNVSFGLPPGSRAPVTSACPVPPWIIRLSGSPSVVPENKTSMPLPTPSWPATSVSVWAVPLPCTRIPWLSEESARMMSAPAGAAARNVTTANVDLMGCFITQSTLLEWSPAGGDTGRNRALARIVPTAVQWFALCHFGTDEPRGSARRAETPQAGVAGAWYHCY